MFFLPLALALETGAPEAGASGTTTAVPTTGAPASEGKPTKPLVPEEEPSPYHVGLGGVALATFDTDTKFELGSGLQFSFQILRHFGIQATLQVVSTTDGRVYGPSDLLARYTWHASKNLQPYVNGGITIVPKLGGIVSVRVGLATAIGFNYWLGPKLGVFVEENTNVILRRGEVFPELGFVLGPIARF